MSESLYSLDMNELRGVDLRVPSLQCGQHTAWWVMTAGYFMFPGWQDTISLLWWKDLQAIRLLPKCIQPQRLCHKQSMSPRQTAVLGTQTGAEYGQEFMLLWSREMTPQWSLACTTRASKPKRPPVPLMMSEWSSAIFFLFVVRFLIYLFLWTKQIYLLFVVRAAQMA